MNKRQLGVLGVVAIVIVFANLMPTGKGIALSCYGGMEHYYTFQKTYGVPMTYFTGNSTGNDCFATDKVTGKDITNVSGKYYDKYAFKSVNFLTDAALGLLVLGVLYVLTSKNGNKK